MQAGAKTDTQMANKQKMRNIIAQTKKRVKPKSKTRDNSNYFLV